MIQRILFLDVDGVLNSSETRKTKIVSMNKKFVDQLTRILKETNCDIVVSSYWSILNMNENLEFFKCLNEACNDVEQYNYIKNKIIGETYKTMSYRPRGFDIKSWIDNEYQEDPNLNYKVLKFVIIDDRNDMEPYHHHLVQTNDDEGLTIEKASEVIELFKKL